MGWASAGFNEDYVGTHGRALDYAAAGGTITIRLAGPWYLRPHVDVYRLVNADVQRALNETMLTSAGLAIGRGYCSVPARQSMRSNCGSSGTRPLSFFTEIQNITRS